MVLLAFDIFQEWENKVMCIHVDRYFWGVLVLVKLNPSFIFFVK